MEQVSYKKLFKLSIDRNEKKSEFTAKVGISQSTLTKMRKGQFISMGMLVKICNYLDCTLDDIVDIL